jgi:ribonuclease HII
MSNKASKKPPLKLFEKEGDVECGVDEAGRGCLCGRVYTAAVILPYDPSSFGDEIYLQIRDSKQLSAKKREMLCAYIEKHAIAYAVTFSEVEEIDSMNILQATMHSMQKAIKQVDEQVKISRMFIDGSYWRDIYRDEEDGSRSKIDATTVIDGDKTYMHIAAASILAKVYRDMYMSELAEKNPEWETRYKWSKNKGYGTSDHISGIGKYGITPVHRRTFAPCKRFHI